MKTEELVNCLNRVHAIDPEVIPILMDYRVVCNEAMANDPTIQVSIAKAVPWVVGFLGLVNGFLDNGQNPVMAVYESDGKLHHFEKFVERGE